MREEVAAADEVGASAGGGWEGIEEYIVPDEVTILSLVYCFRNYHARG
jgi:hypothetical protein